jgi:segregation and condensation protein A
MMALPQLGRNFLPRGEPERFKVIARPVYTATLYDLLKAYGTHTGRRHEGALHILPTDLYSMDDALKRLSGLIGKTVEWTVLASFLPPGLAGGLVRRSALAATFAASLEMARSGRLKLRQDRAFGPIFVRRNEDSQPT